MRCTKCEGELVRKTIENVEVEECDKCSGIWFDFGELREILDKNYQEELKNKIDNNQGMDEKEVPCPKCGGAGKMIPVVDTEHDLRVDTCTVCYGQWLDGGEYEKLKEKSVFDFFRNLL